MSRTEILYSTDTWFTIYNEFKRSRSCNPEYALKNNALLLWSEHINYRDRRRFYFHNLIYSRLGNPLCYNTVKNIILWYMKLQYLKSLKALN